MYELTSGAWANMRGANIQAAAAHNRKVILQSLRRLKTAERGTLADITGLTPPAVFKIVKELLHERLIISPNTRRGGKGPPAAILAINPDALVSIGVSLEQDGLSMVVVDFAGDVRGQRRLAAAQPNAHALRRFFTDALGDCLGKHGFDVSKIAGVGLAVANATALWPAAVTGHAPASMLDLAGNELADLLGRPVHVEEQAIAAAHGIAALDRNATPEPFFYLHLSDHLSGALVSERHVMRGTLKRRNAPATLPQLNPFRSSQTNLGKMIGETASLPAFLKFLGDKGVQAQGLDDIDLMDRRVDAAVGEWIDTVADLLYVPLLSMFCCLNLSAVLIGGPLPQDIIIRLCRALSRRLSLNLGVNWSEMAVQPARLGERAAAVGAALLAFEDRW